MSCTAHHLPIHLYQHCQGLLAEMAEVQKIQGQPVAPIAALSDHQQQKIVGKQELDPIHWAIPDFACASCSDIPA